MNPDQRMGRSNQWKNCNAEVQSDASNRDTFIYLPYTGMLQGMKDNINKIEKDGE